MEIGNHMLKYDITGIVRGIEQRKCIGCKNHSLETCSINGAKTSYSHTCSAFKPNPDQVKIVRDRIESCES